MGLEKFSDLWKRIEFVNFFSKPPVFFIEGDYFQE